MSNKIINCRRLTSNQHPDYSWKELETWKLELDTPSQDIQSIYNAVHAWLENEPMMRWNLPRDNSLIVRRGSPVKSVIISVSVDKAN